MADLENFFAKKDKKKKSSKKSVITPEDLLKKIEQDTHGAADAGYDSNGEQQQQPKASQAGTAGNKDDGEWNEFEEDQKEVDLSTLKIQNLGEKEKERQEEEDAEELQKAVEESRTTMKWNIARKNQDSSDDEDDDQQQKAAAAAAKQAEQAAASAAAEKQQDTLVDRVLAEKAAAGRYIPPSVRAAMAAGGGATPGSAAAGGPSLAPMSMKRGAQRNAKLNVHSAEEFPTLGVAASAPAGAWGSGGPAGVQDGSFTAVRKGASRGDSSAAAGADALSTSNKFSMLKGGSSTRQ